MAQGLDALAEALEEIPQMLSTAAAQGLEKGLQQVAEDARARAPVDTGILRKSIACSLQPTGNGAIGTVRADAVYASAVEFGTGELPAHPFLYPAIKAGAGQIARDIQSALRRAMADKEGAVWRC